MATTQSSESESRREERRARERAHESEKRRLRLWLYAFGAAMLFALVSGAVIEYRSVDPPVEVAPEAAPEGAASIGHVHGLGLVPAGKDVFIATHNGLYRTAGEGSAPVQVSAKQQDFMGFAVADDDRLLASGHPAEQQDRFPGVGLIESLDGGRTWQPVSLSGQADFHVLRADGKRVYGFDVLSGRFMASTDGGRTWLEREPPAPMFDLAIATDDPDLLVAATEDGLFTSINAGRSWRPGGDIVGRIAWAPGRLFVVDERAQVLSGVPGGQLSRQGTLPSPPVAFIAAEDALYAALADGRVLRSADEGVSWTIIAQV